MESCCTIDCKRKGGDGLMNIPSLKFVKVTVSVRIEVGPSAHFILNIKKKKLSSMSISRVVVFVL